LCRAHNSSDTEERVQGFSPVDLAARTAPQATTRVSATKTLPTMTTMLEKLLQGAPYRK
jgi:hypothetical protein